MSISPIDATGSTGFGAQSTSSTGGVGLDMDKDAFLKLLVAQLQYQNPLQPVDGQQYMAQMAQFAQVEKLANIASAQADVLSWQRAVAGEGMVGKYVEGTTPTGAKVDGVVTGLRLATSGPVLELEGGGTLDVTSVDEVLPQAPATPPATSGTGGTSGTSTSGTGTSGTATPGTTTTT